MFGLGEKLIVLKASIIPVLITIGTYGNRLIVSYYVFNFFIVLDLCPSKLITCHLKLVYWGEGIRNLFVFYWYV
jgi:hypothetical protein